MKQDQSVYAHQVYQRRKTIHLNFQEIQLTSVHHHSGHLFECSDMLHVISLPPQEAHCFKAALLPQFASADKINELYK